MTEEIEKQAEEYTDNKYHCNQLECIQGNSCDYCYYGECKQIFQDGAKWGIANAIEWHDLRENPDDLPKNRENVLLYVKLHDKWEREVILVGYRDYGDCLGEYCKDWGYVEPIQNVKYDFVDNEEVIAWCELPTYKE